jgi:hypothetical protein
MATWLDQQIEEIESIVAKCMNLCKEKQGVFGRTVLADDKKPEKRVALSENSRKSELGRS